MACSRSWALSGIAAKVRAKAVVSAKVRAVLMASVILESQVVGNRNGHTLDADPHRLVGTQTAPRGETPRRRCHLRDGRDRP